MEDPVAMEKKQKLQLFELNQKTEYQSILIY